MIKKINKFNLVLFICGTAIFFLLGIIAKISKLLPFDDFEKDCVPVFVSLLIAASAVYFVSVWKFRKNNACSLILIILFGLGFRILFIPSTPILENDFYRYMWDGAVSSSGVNPYEYSPRQVIDGESPEKLKTLKREHEETLKKINHPHVKTIYPPVSQFFFALSYKLSPMSLEAWRIIMILFDLTTLGLLLLSLGRLKIPLQSSIVYWWNPLLVKEIFNSAHMDVVAFPFVLAAIFLFLSGSKRICVLILSLAAGVKLWPALLFGLFIKPFSGKARDGFANSYFHSRASGNIFTPDRIESGAEFRGADLRKKLAKQQPAFLRYSLFVGSCFLARLKFTGDTLKSTRESPWC